MPSVPLRGDLKSSRHDTIRTVGGAAIGLGLSLFAKRFSLRSLLIAFGLVAVVTSTPPLLIQAREPKAILDVKIGRVLTAEEWTVLKRACSKEGLCAAVRPKTIETLPCPVANALRTVELQPQTGGTLESSGTVGVRLALRFSDELERSHIGNIFNELATHVREAMPPGKGP